CSLRRIQRRTPVTGSELDDEAANARHTEKMRKHKAAKDKIMATKTGDKGLLIVHTGTGKGKTSAALGMVFRHIGHGWAVGPGHVPKASRIHNRATQQGAEERS